MPVNRNLKDNPTKYSTEGHLGKLCYSRTLNNQNFQQDMKWVYKEIKITNSNALKVPSLYNSNKLIISKVYYKISV